MTKIEIKNRWTGEVIYSCNVHDSVESGIAMRHALEKATHQKVDLRYSDLSNSNLRGSDLSNVDLRGSDLSDVDLSDANLRGSNLSNVDLSDANLRGSDLSNSNLRGSNLSNVDLRGSNLSDVDLRGSDLSNVDLSDANLRGSDLSNANLSNANLSNVDLRGSNLSNVNLRGSNLSNVDLSDANLRGSNLSNVDLSDANLSNANLSDADGNSLRASPEQSIENLDKVRSIVLHDKKRLEMSHWHGDTEWKDRSFAEETLCGTTHCLAGWLQVSSPNPEIRQMDAELAGILSAPVAAKMFFRKADEVLNWLETRAYVQELQASSRNFSTSESIT